MTKCYFRLNFITFIWLAYTQHRNKPLVLTNIVLNKHSLTVMSSPNNCTKSQRLRIGARIICEGKIHQRILLNSVLSGL